MYRYDKMLCIKTTILCVSADDDQRERGKSSFQFVVDCGWNMMTIMMGRRFIYRKKYNVENARKPSSVLYVLF